MNGINHLALIMDGNGRWATERSLNRTRGHIAGAQSAVEIIRHVCHIEIPVLSLFAFSKENWNRPKIEVITLMRLLARSLEEQVPFFSELGVRLKVVGDRDGLPKAVIKAICRAEDMTSMNKGLHLLVALNYSGQYDICQAIRHLYLKGTDLSKLSAQELQGSLLTGGIQNPDLIIRTGGECRLSNFFLWQSAYSEIHFSDKFWPDFKGADLNHHLQQFCKTERRYGRTSAQVVHF